jgi:hypothetical protein
MKSFKQLMSLIKEEKELDRQFENDLGYKEKRTNNPHSILHEVETVAHYNAMSDARKSGVSNWQSAKPTDTHYSQIMPKEELDKLRADVDKGPSIRNVAAVQSRAARDAGILSSEHPEHERAHWTPHSKAREKLHPGVSHSGDVVLIHKNESKPAIAADLKWRKGGSISPVPLHKVIQGLGSMENITLSALNRTIDRMKRSRPETSVGRGTGFGLISKHIHNAFNALDHNSKREFMRKLWGGSSHPEKVKSVRLDSSGKIENINDSFQRNFPKNSNIQASRVPTKIVRNPSEPGKWKIKNLARGIRFSSNGIHKVTWSPKYNDDVSTTMDTNTKLTTKAVKE